ncbi:MAG: IclR family transcriptional regulator [Betaproteobacteria bacterium]|nr:IclR family transcriptional regulator [Betaproteobacteria bacterium]
MHEELEGKHGVQSMEVGIGLLKAMADGGSAMMLKDIAAAAGMPPSKAHRYLVSLIRSGLVEQDPHSSRYALGPFALNLGLVALDRIDRIRLGLSAITHLRDEINETTALAVWSLNGPVVVRWERPHRPITVNVSTGTVRGLLTSAAGRVFSAWQPENQIAPLLEQEIKDGKAPPEIETLDAALALLANVRAQGVAIISGDYVIRGVEAAAAPVFNFKNELSLALVIIGVEGVIDMEPNGATINALKNAALALSKRLGWRPDTGIVDN